jgi:hypothetical protein
MTRTYAAVFTAIWDNEAFQALDDVDQRTYLMLVSQSDISAAGVLALRIRRWAKYSRNTSTDPDRLTGSLARLADARFIVIDTDHEELLVRSFVRHDKGYSNPKRRPSIIAASQDVRSPIVRRALAAELSRLGLPTGELDDDLSEGLSDSHPDSLSASRDDHSIDDGLNTQANSLSDSHTDRVSPSDRVVVTQGPYLDRTPQPTTPNPVAAATAEEERTPDEETALVDAVRTIRPEWSPRAIRRAIGHPDVLARPWRLVQPAMLAVARDADSQSPGRLSADGPWWRVGALPKPPPPTCPKHRGQPAHTCGPCRSERLGAE